MKTIFPILFCSFSLLFCSCNKSKQTLDLKKQYLSTLGYLNQDFNRDNKYLTNKSDNDGISKKIKFEDNTDYSTWHNVKYKNGEEINPSKSTYHIYNKTVKNTITVTNNEKYDAVVSLFQINKTSNSFRSPAKGTGRFYIKAGQYKTFKNLSNATYRLSAELGTDWKEKQFGKNKNRINGKFSKNKHSFYKSGLRFEGNTHHNIEIKDAQSSKKTYHSKTEVIYEDNLGNPIQFHELDSIFKHKGNQIDLKPIINEGGLVECYIINPK